MSPSPQPVHFLDLRTTSEVRKDLDAAYKRVMDSGCFVLGPELRAFEEEFAGYVGVDHCVGVGNGLEALTLILQAYGVKKGDEVGSRVKRVCLGLSFCL
jgi:dTDP-4-amino-4,6-dideoxygalactose transaminase